MRRWLANLILFIAIFALPWWLFVLLGLVWCFLFKNYYELIVLSFVRDLVFSAPAVGWLSHQFTLTIILAMLMLLIEESKKQLRWYS